MCADAMGSGCVNQVSDAGTEVCRHKENALVHEVGEGPRVAQFECGAAPPEPLVFANEPMLRSFALGILITILHVRMSWRTVEVEVILFDILAVIALAVR